MAASFLHVRTPGVLLVFLLLTSSLGIASAPPSPKSDSTAGRWTFVDFSLTPSLAVFRSDAGEHPVPVGKELPGTRIRLDALSEEGATLLLESPDGRPLRLKLARGQQIDAEQTLREIGESLDRAYAPASPEQDDGDAH
jgi:hypothetical protein